MLPLFLLSSLFSYLCCLAFLFPCSQQKSGPYFEYEALKVGQHFSRIFEPENLFMHILFGPVDE